MTEPLAIVLAAGQGTRMKSDLPKVLCPVLGKPMLEYVLAALSAAGVERTIVVVGYRAELVRETLAGRPNIQFAEQTERLGTGHAVKMTIPQLSAAADADPVLIVAGDSPMLQAASLQKLLAIYRESRPAALLGTLHKANPTGLGRIVRDAAGAFTGIVEEKDASPEQRQITEVNMSTYLFRRAALLTALGKLKNENRQKEFYLTDCPGILRADGERVEAHAVLDPREALSINTPEELALVEQAMTVG
jgi:UDP-N-acetylglucosamine diphosphorylase/glucosamine-1-phosphate N-acetyltransferase